MPLLAEDTVVKRANPVEIHNLFHWKHSPGHGEMPALPAV